jgi:Uma2 family endonuclease
MGLILDLPRVELHMPPDVELDDDVFFAICQANPDYRIERTARGDIQIMPPTGGVTGRRNSDLNAEVNLWARRDGRGVAFDSSTGFILPNGAVVSPDCSWVLRERLARLSEAEKSRFLPLAPDFVIELSPANDGRGELIAKMRDYQANGVRLGWLILPTRREIYRFAGQTPLECLEDPASLSDEEILPGFTLDLAGIWSAGF